MLITMERLSLVADAKIERDPRKLAYLYPSMPLRRYKELVDEYYRNLALRAAEQMAQMSGCVLLPSACVHHKRRDPARRLMLFGRTYYSVPEDEMTELEHAKYQSFCMAEGY